MTINYALTMLQNKIFINGLARLAAKGGFPYNLVLKTSVLLDVAGAVRSEMFCHVTSPVIDKGLHPTPPFFFQLKFKVKTIRFSDITHALFFVCYLIIASYNAAINLCILSKSNNALLSHKYLSLICHLHFCTNINKYTSACEEKD